MKYGKEHGNYKHGKPNGYHSWLSLKDRCTNQKCPSFVNYGGRGIKVCDRWLGEHGFECFIIDMGPKPGPGYSIDRIDTDGDYSPENCRWATAKEQANNKRSNHVIKGKTLSEWGEELGGSRYIVQARIKRGWTIDDAIRTPIGNPALDRKKIRRANQHNITAFGKTQGIRAWARETGIDTATISKRINKYGWDAEKAVSIFPHKKKKLDKNSYII